VGFQQRRLHARRVIFLKLRDLLEQRRTAGVVKEAAGKAARLRRESGKHCLREILARGIKPRGREARRPVEVFDDLMGEVSFHQASLARRSPMNCQR
jgi:hypothetical protein